MNITIPSVGESITEGTIARWLKKEGDRVRQGEPLFELETDKATTEVPAPASGTLHIRVQEGQAADVGATIGTVQETGDGQQGRQEASVRTAPARQTETAAKETPAAKEPEPQHELQPRSGREPARQEPAAARHRREWPRQASSLSPAAKRLTAERPSQPPSAPPTDSEQVEAVRKEPAAARPATPGQNVTRQPMSAIRQRIGERLLASQKSTATLTTFNEADLTALLDLRNRFKENFRKRHGVGLGIVSFFVKACTYVLEQYPIINAAVDGSDIVYHHFANIGVAVSTDKGLIVPVLRSAEQMTFAAIEKKIAELAEKARAGKIAVQDLQDGTFTITNGGVFGSLLSTPILNPPQSAILGLHSIQKRPVALEDQVVIRPMMYLALSYDHRLIDGQEAVQFLVQVKNLIERPERMLLDV
jgi:2-oxoglutarate dehydrogenase E2 component (dihydrolipoamide succinyltransferase)